jgi:hypothetical protein
MRYLRMLTNAVTGGVLGAAYLAVLVLQLNPQVPIASTTAMRWFGTLVMFYGLYLSVAIYLLILVREALSLQPLRPAWLSVRLLAWLGAAGATAAALVTWANLKGYRAMLNDAAAERLRQGATATTVFAVVLAIVAVWRYSAGRRGNRTTATILFAAMLLSVGVPLWLRGPGELPVPRPHTPGPVTAPTPAAPGGRVRLILLDGAGLDFIRQRVAAGQLPNFGRLLDRGAVVDLATLKPTQVETVWAAAATGKYPPKDGVRSRIHRVQPTDVNPVDLLPDFCFSQSLVYQSFVTEDRFITTAALRARPWWDILAEYGLASGVVNWPVSYPAHADRGYLITERFDEAASSPLRDARAGAPTSATDIAREVFDVWQNRSWQDVMPPDWPSRPPPDELQPARWDRAYSNAAAELEKEFPTRVTALRYEGLDEFGHNGLREAEPELFGEFGRSGQSRSSLDRYYTFIDLEVGRTIDQLAPGDLVLVISSFGMEQETLAKRLLARAMGWPELSGTHERAPDGFLIAFGSNVAANASLTRGAIVDVAPTVLYYVGVPVGRDMDGFARADLFLRSYAAEHPVTSIATHER